MTIWNEIKLIDLDIPEYTISLCINSDNEKEYCFIINKECVNEKVYSQAFIPPNFLFGHDLDYIVLKCSDIFGMNKEYDRPNLLKKITAININFNKYSKVETQNISLPQNPYKLTSDAVALKVVSEPLLTKQLLNSYLSAYTNNPLNLAIIGPSGEGKTYPALNTLKLFPKQDVMIYAGASPKSFIHDNGILVNNEFHPIEADIKEIENEIEILKYKKDDDPKYIRERKKELTNELKEIKRETKTLIDFENKILLLLDAPPKELWDNLKTLLSHDQFYLEFKFVNNDKGIKTEKVVFKGFPAFVVASARDESKWDVWEEIKTRVMVTNPDMDEAKYKKVFGFISKAYENPWQVFEAKEEHKLEKEAKKTIKTLKQLMLNERNNMREMSNEHDESEEQLVWIPYANLIAEHYKADKGARQREIKQFMQNITMNAWWNAPNRAFLIRRDENKKYRFLIATPEDFFSAEQIFRTQGIVDFKLEFYHNIFYPCYVESEKKHQTLENEGKILYPFPGISVSELRQQWKKVKGSKITGQLLQNGYLKELDREGFIEDLGVDNKLHKQKHWYRSLVKGRTLNLDSAKKPLMSGLTVDFDVVLTKEVYIELIKPLMENTKNIEIETYQGESISINELLDFRNKNTIEALSTVQYSTVKENNRNQQDNINNNPISINGSLSKNKPSLTNQSLNKPLKDDINGFLKTSSPQNIERQEKLVKLAKEFGDDEETLKMELMNEFNYTLDMALQDINTLRKSGVITNDLPK